MLACSRAQYQRGTRWASGKRPNTVIPHISTERNPPQHGSPPTPPGLFGGLEAARPKAPHLHTTTTPYAALCGPQSPCPPVFVRPSGSAKKIYLSGCRKLKECHYLGIPFFFQMPYDKKRTTCRDRGVCEGRRPKKSAFCFTHRIVFLLCSFHRSSSSQTDTPNTFVFFLGRPTLRMSPFSKRNKRKTKHPLLFFPTRIRVYSYFPKAECDGVRGKILAIVV